MIAITAVCMVISPYTRILFFCIVGLIACWEMARCLKKLKANCSVPVLYAYVAGHCLLCCLNVGPAYCIAWFVLCVMAAMITGVLCKSVSGVGAMATAAVLSYPLLPFAVISYISVGETWFPVFLLACAATWICDSFALFGGKLFGKHKIAPVVSPNKTVEGCVCGAVFSVLAGVAVYFMLRSSAAIPLWICMSAAFVGSTAGQFGDLAASLIKRTAKIKDYSNLIPGHGGVMDRVDSLLFSIPAVYWILVVLNVL